MAARVRCHRVEVDAVEVDTVYPAEALGLTGFAAEEVESGPANLAMRIVKSAHYAFSRRVIDLRVVEDTKTPMAHAPSGVVKTSEKRGLSLLSGLLEGDDSRFLLGCRAPDSEVCNKGFEVVHSYHLRTAVPSVPRPDITPARKRVRVSQRSGQNEGINTSIRTTDEFPDSAAPHTPISIWGGRQTADG